MEGSQSRSAPGGRRKRAAWHSSARAGTVLCDDEEKEKMIKTNANEYYYKK